MAISTVKAVIDGTTYNLTYNSSTGNWEATVTAPGKTSYNENNHYYNVQITAVNDAGTTGTADASTLDGLKFYVKEKVKPIAKITSPTSGVHISNNLQPIIGQVTDEVNGSGVDISTLVVKVDGVALTNVKTTAITQGYQFTATPSTNYSNGQHTVTVDVSDFDGNAAVTASVSFEVDTIPPTLSVTSPTNNYITNTAKLSVIGTTNDNSDSPVTVTVKLNGTDQGAVTVNSDGSFQKDITLAEGANTIIVTAKDAAGQTTSITLTVTLDTSVPRITAASVTPNPADAGSTVIIAVKIS